MSESTDLQRTNKGSRARGLANLKPFKKGQSGNPAGRPKSAILSDAYRRKLAEVDPKDPQQRTFAEVLAEKMILKARAGDVHALREIADRVEGKAKQTLNVSFERRERLETQIQRILEQAHAEGVQMTREEAIAEFSILVPDASSLMVN